MTSKGPFQPKVFCDSKTVLPWPRLCPSRVSAPRRGRGHTVSLAFGAAEAQHGTGGTVWWAQGALLKVGLLPIEEILVV